MRYKLFIAALIAGLCMLNSINAQNRNTYSVTNQSGFTIKSFSISPHDANTWTQNLITTTKTVLNTESFEFKQTVNSANCSYDLKFTTDEGVDYYMKDINLCKRNSLTLVIPTKEQR